jgi:hypothetical protein
MHLLRRYFLKHYISPPQPMHFHFFCLPQTLYQLLLSIHYLSVLIPIAAVLLCCTQYCVYSIFFYLPVLAGGQFCRGLVAYFSQFLIQAAWQKVPIRPGTYTRVYCFTQLLYIQDMHLCTKQNISVMEDKHRIYTEIFQFVLC